jgi:hypothetical protein
VTEKNFPAKELSYQMSPLLLANLGTRSARIAEHWVCGPAFYPLGHEILVERIILILELLDEL